MKNLFIILFATMLLISCTATQSEHNMVIQKVEIVNPKNNIFTCKYKCTIYTYSENSFLFYTNIKYNVGDRLVVQRVPQKKN